MFPSVPRPSIVALSYKRTPNIRPLARIIGALSAMFNFGAVSQLV